MKRKIGTYKIPSEYKDEDKWFKFFTIPQVFAIAIVLLLSFIVFKFLSALHLAFIGACIDIVIILLAVLIIFAPIPENKYLIGGGQPFRVVFINFIRKKLPKNKIIYVKNYGREDEE